MSMAQGRDDLAGVGPSESGAEGGPAVRHWFAPPPPPVLEVAISKDLVPAIFPWDCTEAGPGVELAAPPAWRNEPPRAISIPIRRSTVRVRSYAFPEPTASTVAPPAGEDVPSESSRPTIAPAWTLTGATRIRPPADVIKLQDRLHYLLEPTLEMWLSDRSLALPFQPFPFQFEGVAFLYPRHAAVLADEMGLGKTMQAITAIRLLLRRGEVGSVLMICPKPLVTNWQREFHLWAPEIPVMTIGGDQVKRTWQWRLPDVPLRIANYELVVRDREVLERSGIGGEPPVRFDLVVLDESQRIKNRSGTTSEVVRSIGRKRSWALTGTPVENSAEDLVGIFEFLAPGFLSPETKPRKMGRAVSNYVLRRTKDQVLTEMPPKMFRDAELELTPEQRETYRLAEDEGVVRLTEMGDGATIQHVFELVLRLKQICNFDPATGASSKIERLEADLEEVADSGRKAIVFSQWVATIERLAKSLHRFGPLQYHGKIPSGRRDGVIAQFREDPKAHVILMSYGAGGVGLNLQFASYVFLFDRWWNPAVEDQAINRAHRIGASGPVTVTRMLMLDTIEERIDHILQEKRELFDTIFSGADSPHKLSLTQQELFGLFRLKCPGGAVDRAA